MRDKPLHSKPKNKVRNTRIRTLAAEGKTQSEIAEEVGMSRGAINRVLNSEETKQIVSQAESRLIALGGKAISTLEAALDNHIEDSHTAVRAAGIVLKAIGIDQKNKDELQEVRKPFVIHRLDGSQTIMGHATEHELCTLRRLGLLDEINN